MDTQRQQLPADWPEWCTAQQLAARWNMHPSTVYRLHHNDPDNFGRMLGGQLRIHRSMIEARERLEVQRESVKAVRSVRRQKMFRSSGVDHFASPNTRERT